MKKITSIFAFILLTMFSLHAGNIVVNSGGNTQLDITQSTYETLSFRSTLSDISSFEVKTNKGIFTQLQIQDYGYSMIVGDPKLPILKEVIEIPYGATIKIDISNQVYKEFKLSEFGITYPIIPAQLSVEKSKDPSLEKFEINTNTYAKNQFIGQDLVKVIELGVMRAKKLARLELAPIQYNPATGTIRVYSQLDVKISFENADIEKTIRKNQELASPYYNRLYNSLLNNEIEGGKELITVNPATYIIVSDPLFENALQPFIDWKTKKGFNVVLALTSDANVGTTTTSIKSYLEDFYNNPPTGYTPQTFVLIVGDVAQVPTFSGTAAGHVTDLYYHDYTGDIYPECYYGRFSANNLLELQPQIDKTLEYEQYLFPDDSFLEFVLMVSGVDSGNAPTYGNGQINYGTDNYFNEDHGITSHTYLYPESIGITQNIIDHVNDGITFGNYTAHCSSNGWADPSFVISHISQLTNEHMYPLLVGNCCSSVEFQTTCFGEEMLRAENKGALGYIGGSNSTYWDEDYYWGVGYKEILVNPPYDADKLGAYDRLFHDHGEAQEDWYITQDQVLQGGNLAVTQSGSTRETYYYEIYHLMGDPSLMNYLSIPEAATANYANLMPLGATTFTVNTDPNALVAISKDGVLHGTGMADATGLATIDMFNPIAVSGTADIVITNQNVQPFIGTITVASSNGAYLLFDAMVVDDAAGNGNGNADYHEDILLDVSLSNVGTETGSNLSATITTTSADITITDYSATWADISAGSTGTTTGAFAFTVADYISDMETVTFDIEITDGTDTWTGNFNVILHAPIITLLDYTINDASGNGKLDPGESAELLLNVIDNGSADALNVIGLLTTTSPYITISTSSNNYGTISAGQSSVETYVISVSEAAPAGTIADFSLALSADYGYTNESTFSEVIGQIPVLILDWDPNTSSGPAIEQAIIDNNVAVTYMTACPSDLSMYSSIFVCLGIYSTNYVLPDDKGQLLADYLNAGGKLYMEGGDTWAYNSATPVHPMFNINGEANGNSDLSTINGQDGTFASGMTFAYDGENSYIDHISATGSGELLFANEAVGYGITVINDAGSYKTIGASYEFGGMVDASSPNTKAELMAKYLEFFEIGGNSTSLTAFFNADNTVVSPGGQVSFTDLSLGNPTSWEWTFEGGTPATSTEQNPVVTYNTPSVYDVTLTVSDGTDESTLVKEDYIEVTVGIVESTINDISIYPNPFTDQLFIEYYLKENSTVKISILSALGREIEVLQDVNNQINGQHRATLNSTQYDAGIYFVKIQTEDSQIVKRVVLTK